MKRYSLTIVIQESLSHDELNALEIALQDATMGQGIEASAFQLVEVSDRNATTCDCRQYQNRGDCCHLNSKL
jgi:hypothetical protein